MEWLGTAERLQRINAVAGARQQGVVVLEDIHDPHNAEAVFRTCDALGFQRICLVFSWQRPFDPHSIGKQSSSSAHKWLSFETYRSTPVCLQRLHEEGYQVIATAVEGECESLYSACLDAPKIALMLGNEHLGLSSTALEMSDRRLSMPMRGMVQSLNLSVTAAICLYEITRQRIALGMEEFLLSESESVELADDLKQR